MQHHNINPFHHTNAKGLHLNNYGGKQLPRNFTSLLKMVDICKYMLFYIQNIDISPENSSIGGSITKLKKSVGWTIDKFRLNNSLAINDKILRFAYREIDVQSCTFSNFWDFCCT